MADRPPPPEANHDAATSSFFVAAPSIALPKGGGAIRGIGEKFAANPVTGTASMSVPIATSPGRLGFGPQLSLSYDSGVVTDLSALAGAFLYPRSHAKPTKGCPSIGMVRTLTSSSCRVRRISFQSTAKTWTARGSRVAPVSRETRRDPGCTIHLAVSSFAKMKSMVGWCGDTGRASRGCSLVLSAGARSTRPMTSTGGPFLETTS